MKKNNHLKFTLLVIVAVLALAIGAADWISPIFMALYIYYFTFTLNLFFKLYEKEDFITRIFFGTNKTPVYLAMATMVIVIVFLRKAFPKMDFDPAYLSAFIGVCAYTIGRIKRRELIPRD